MYPAIRPSLKTVRLGPDRFVLLDPQGSERLEIGPAQRRIVEMLDGTRDVEDVCALCRAEGFETFGRADVESFIRDLDRRGLLTGSGSPADSDSGTGVPASAPPSASPPAPLSDQDVGAGLNHRFDVLAALFGWLAAPWTLVGLALVTAVAVMGIAHGADRYARDLLEFATGAGLPLIVAILVVRCLVLTLVRELLVGVACRRAGGRIRRFGLRFLGHIVPSFQCDTGDSVAFAAKSGRWTLATIRSLTHLAMADLAVVGWMMSAPGSSLRTFWLVLLIPALIGLVLHLNVLMPMDACACLSLALDEGRLRDRAIAVARAWIGRRPAPELLSPRRQFWFRVYGLATLVWDTMAPVGVIILAGWYLTDAYRGTGALIGLVLLALHYQDRIGETLMKNSAFRWAVRGGGSATVRWGIRLGVVVLLIACGFIPYAREVGGQCFLVPADKHGIRAQIADEIAEVHVRDGDLVDAGDVIVTLAARDERANVATTRAQLERSRADLALLRAGNRPEEVEKARQELELRRIQLAHDQFMETQTQTLNGLNIELARQAVELRDIEYKHAEYELKRVEQLTGLDQASESEFEKARSTHDAALQSLSIARENLKREQEQAAVATEKATNAVESARQNLAIAQNNYDVIREGSRREQIDAAEADVARLEALLSHYEELLALREIKTPISGRIVTSGVRQRLGQFVQPGDLIAVVYDTSRLMVEVAADQEAGTQVEPGMRVKIRPRGLDGALLTGTVQRVATETVDIGEITIDQIRTDRESRLQEAIQQSTDRYVRVWVVLDEGAPTMLPGMTGEARIVLGRDRLWSALARPVVRFLRVDVWSWLP